MRTPNSNAQYRVETPSYKEDEAYDVSRRLPESGGYNTLNEPATAYLLEMEDMSFGHDSAVPRPGLPPAPSDPSPVLDQGFSELFFRQIRDSHPDLYQRRRDLASYQGLPELLVHRRGYAVLAAAFTFLYENPDFHLLLAGHTDTSGTASYNFGLSDLRARAVHALLVGDRDAWVEIVQDHHRVADYQHYCQFLSLVHGWPCDPGPIDDDHGSATDAAVRAFQRHYNEAFGATLAVDGDVGPATWGAFFDVGEYDIKQLINTGADGLSRARAKLRFVDATHPYIGCGETMPIEQPDRDRFRSAENRRVEFLFFHAAFLPELGKHLVGGPLRTASAKRLDSPVYSPRYYRYHLLEVISWFGAIGTGTTGKFRIDVLPPAVVDDEPEVEPYTPGNEDLVFDPAATQDDT